MSLTNALPPRARVVLTRGQWTCQRQSQGHKCGAHNPNRLQLCATCGKRRPPRKRAAHLAALELSYEGFVKLNGGEHCAVCKRERTAKRRLDRDHDHKTGEPRGLLCARCNRALPSWITPAWLEAALAYLLKHSERTT